MGAMLIDSKVRGDYHHEADVATYFDPTLKTSLARGTSTVSQEVNSMAGQRFKGEEWLPKKEFVNPEHPLSGPTRHPVVVVMNARGIGILRLDDVLETHSWKQIKSFGAKMHRLGDDTFAFTVEEGDKDKCIAISSEAATAMDSAAMHYVRMWEGPGYKPPPFPAEYHPGE